MALVNVGVTIPEERVADFYAMVAAWLNPAPESTEPGLSDWTADDIEQARYVWEHMSPAAQQLFAMLPVEPEHISAEALADVLGPTADSFTVAGTFSWPARHAKDVGRARPVKWGETPQGGVYWLDPVVKTLFEKVAADAS